MAGQFRLDKEVFCILWKNNLDVNAGWRAFCLALFERFEKTNLNRLRSDGKTHAYTHTGVTTGKSKEAKDSQYAFISERAFIKCKKINAELKSKGFETQPYPAGADKRNGPISSKTLTPEDIRDIFSGAYKSDQS